MPRGPRSPGLDHPGRRRALGRAETESLSDAEARARRRERDAERRAELDRDYLASFAGRVREPFPGTHPSGNTRSPSTPVGSTAAASAAPPRRRRSSPRPCASPSPPTSATARRTTTRYWDQAWTGTRRAIASPCRSARCCAAGRAGSRFGASGARADTRPASVSQSVCIGCNPPGRGRVASRSWRGQQRSVPGQAGVAPARAREPPLRRAESHRRTRVTVRAHQARATDRSHGPFTGCIDARTVCSLRC